MTGDGPWTRESCPPYSCGPGVNCSNVSVVGDRPVIRERYPLHERVPPGFSWGHSGMTISEGDARMRMPATGYSQLESGHVQPLRAQGPVNSGVPQTAGSGTGNVTGYSEEYVALLQRLLEIEGGRALYAQIQGTWNVVQAEWVPVVRRIVQADENEGRGQTQSNSVAVGVRYPLSDSGIRQDSVLESGMCTPFPVESFMDSSVGGTELGYGSGCVGNVTPNPPSIPPQATYPVLTGSGQGSRVV